MKDEAFIVTNLALKDEYVVGEKLNTILKIRLQLYSEITKKPKPRAKKKK